MGFASYPFRKYRRQNIPSYSAFWRALFASVSQSRLVMALRHFDRLSDRGLDALEVSLLNHG